MVVVKWIGFAICIGWPIYEFFRLSHKYEEEQDKPRQWTEDDL